MPHSFCAHLGQIVSKSQFKSQLAAKGDHHQYQGTAVPQTVGDH